MIQFIENSYGTKDTTYILYLHMFMKTTGVSHIKLFLTKEVVLLSFQLIKVVKVKDDVK